MKKGITPIIGIVLVVMMTIVVAGSFFYWFSAIQDKAQERTSSNQEVAVKTFLTKAGSIVDAFYSTIEEADLNALADFEVDVCNNGDNTIDMTAQKGVHVIEKSKGGTVCAESKLDGLCVENTTYILAGLSFNGSSTPSGTPAAIVYSTDGVTWTEAGGINVTENVMAFTLHAVKAFGESPGNLWSISNGTLDGSESTRPTGRLSWTEDVGTWNFINTTERNSDGVLVNYVKGFSMTNTSPPAELNTMYIGAGDNNSDARIIHFEPTFGDNVDVRIALSPPLKDMHDVVCLPGGNCNPGDSEYVSAILALSDKNQLLIGTADSRGIGATIYYMGPPLLPRLTTIINVTLPNSTRINDFERLPAAGEILASTTNGTSGSVDSDVYATPDTNLDGWVTTNFAIDVGSDLDVRTLLSKDYDDALPTIYAGYNTNTNDNNQNATIVARSGGGIGGTPWKAEPAPQLTFKWVNKTIYDLEYMNSTGYFYAAFGAANGTVNRSEIWRTNADDSGFPNDDNWTMAYSNGERGAVTSLIIDTKCTKRNVNCVNGCNTTFAPGTCRDLVFSLENTNCDIDRFSPETEFELRFTSGRHYTQSFNFQKNQDPSKAIKDGTYAK